VYGYAYVFINYKQALKFGHLGWGFLLEDGLRCCYGSADHLWRAQWWDPMAVVRYAYVPPDGHIDWWLAEGSESSMLVDMRAGHHIRYHAYKVLAIENANPQAARLAARTAESGGWALFGNNCVNQAFRILTEYGAGPCLPPPHRPFTNSIPRRWFETLEGPIHWLRDS